MNVNDVHTSYAGGRLRARRTVQRVLRRELALRSSALDPRHVEAWLRENHPTVPVERVIACWKRDAAIDDAIRAIESHGVRESETLARQYGL